MLAVMCIKQGLMTALTNLYHHAVLMTGTEDTGKTQVEVYQYGGTDQTVLTQAVAA